jgi:membrane fusion protein, multidrug efflux system
MPGLNCCFGDASRKGRLRAGRYFSGQDDWWVSTPCVWSPWQWVSDMTEHIDGPGSIDAQPAAQGDAPAAREAGKSARKRKLLAGLGVVVLVVLVVFGIPAVVRMFNTVSTDDAYVNGHVTFVAPRVAGQIARVLVDDNNRVHKGDLLAALDKESYQVAVAEKQAAVDTASADLLAASAAVRAVEAQAMSRRWDLQHAVENVDNQIALLHARVAAIDKSKAALVLAQVQFDRARALVGRADVTREEYDTRQAELTTAGAQLVQTLAEVYQVRVSLGLPAQPPKGGDLDDTFSSVLEAQAELIQSAAQLGVVHSFNQRPRAMIEQFENLGDVNTTFARYEANAPAVKQAEAKLEAARRDLAQAELDLRYCDIVAEIDGVVTRRNVNPGNFVQVGQNLMAVRSLSEIWVDANFKETQLRDLRIGQQADLRVDMYGGTHIFKGRVSGFTMGTGSTLALLPPENATGNFVKVVQRLPIRIDLIDYNPDQAPLFIGTSVTPYVYINKPPTGPDGGKFLQVNVPPSQSPGAPSPGQ